MSGKKKGNIANPDLHSSESPAKDGNELKNRINETAKYSELFEKIDVDSDYDDILATYEKTLDKRTRAAMKKAGGVADEEESVDENVMIEAGENSFGCRFCGAARSAGNCRRQAREKEGKGS